MKKTYLFILFLLISASFIYAQVDFEINNSVTVEVGTSLYIEVSGDLIENGTGYLNGAVTSGDRGNDAISSFAGLNISTGAVDKITRTTGTAYSASSPKTALRSYEVENTTAVNSDITSTILESGSNIETNTISTPFLYSYDGANWTGYLNNSTITDSIGANSFIIPAGNSDIVISEGVGAAAKIFLEGPYTSSAMATDLTAYIPSASPYSEDPDTVSSIPADAVDWVLVQLRDDTTPSTVITSKAAFVNNLGNVIDKNGNTDIGLPTEPGTYYLSVKHRNHLAVMSSSSQSITWITP